MGVALVAVVRYSVQVPQPKETQVADRSLDELHTSDDHRKECVEWLAIARRDISAPDQSLALLHAQAHATLAVSLELSALVEMFYARG